MWKRKKKLSPDFLFNLFFTFVSELYERAFVIVTSNKSFDSWAELREHRGIKQTDIDAFSQTAISKLERRKDMKLSTLIDYLEGIGMGLELRVYPKNGEGSHKTETLLRAWKPVVRLEASNFQERQTYDSSA